MLYELQVNGGHSFRDHVMRRLDAIEQRQEDAEVEIRERLGSGE